MKNMILLPLLSVMLIGCDAPQRSRIPYKTDTGSITNASMAPSQFSPVTNTTSGGNNGTTPAPTGVSELQGIAGFETCDLTLQYYTSGIGYMGVCQNTKDETLLAVKPSTTDSSLRTCLIPTYKDSTGSSAYIGQPQCFFTEQNKVVTGQLYKTRSGFQQNTLNGVMVMKENSLGAYFKCMDAYATYKSPACPYGPKTNITCEQYARSYMNQVCSDFKVTNSYIDIRLKR